MCLEFSTYERGHVQSGFMMPLALFIVIGLGALAIAISRMGSGNYSSAVQEALSVQAFFAAESGAQYGLHRLLFDVSSKADADARCAAINGASLIFVVAGLRDCSVQLSCTTVSNSGDSAGVYRIQSTSSCGSAALLAQRSVVTAARYD